MSASYRNSGPYRFPLFYRGAPFVIVGRQSAEWVVQPAMPFQEVSKGVNGEWVPQSRVVEPAVGEDTIEE
jgi:hypothetical protein